MIAILEMLLLVTILPVLPRISSDNSAMTRWQQSLNHAGDPQQQRPQGSTLIANNDLQPSLALRLYPGGHTDIVCYSPDGKLLAVAGGRDDVKLLDAKTGKQINKLNLFSEEEDAEIDLGALVKTVNITTLAFSPDSTILAVGNSIGQVKLFEVETGLAMYSLDGVNRDEQLHDFFKLRLAHGSVAAIAFSPDGSTIATSGGAIDYQRDGVNRLRSPVVGILRLWDLPSGKLTSDIKNEHSGHVYGVGFALNGKLLVSIGHFAGAARGGSGLKVWDSSRWKIKSVNPLPLGSAAGSMPRCLGVSADGKRVAMGVWKYDKSTDERSGSVHVYYPASGIMDLSWTVPIPVQQLAFTPDDQYIVTRTAAAEITLRDASTGTPKHVLKPVGNPKQVRWTSFSFSPAENVIAIGGKDGENRNCVELWTLGETGAAGE